MKLTIFRKMLIGIGVVILCMSATSVYMMMEMRGVSDATRYSFITNVRAADLAKQMRSVLFDEEPYAQKAAALKDIQYYKVFQEQARVFSQFSDSLSTLDLSNEETFLLARVQQSHTWLSEAVRRSTFSAKANVEYSNEQARSDTLDVLHADLDHFITLNETTIQSSLTAISESRQGSSNFVYFLAAGALFAAIGAGVFMTRAVMKPIRALVQGTEAIAGGTFSPIRVTAHDEMGFVAASLNEMNERLESIDKTNREMMLKMSHELRTPLQAMTSALNLMSDQRYGTLNNEQLRLTAFLREGINKITTFSRQILDISKIESGRMNYQFAPADLLSVLVPLVEEARLIAVRKNITVAMETVSVPKVKADGQKLSQIYSSLLINTINHTPENGLIQVDVNNSTFGVRVSVTDSGAGIPPEDLPNLFTKSSQAKIGNQATDRGSDAGMAIVKTLVEAHEGRVFAESTLGKGATITVEIPAIKELMPPKYTMVQQSVN